MNEEKKKRIHLIYSIVLTAAIVVSGLLLMGACLQIYLSGGEQIYTPEKVAVAFGRIAAPVYVCLGLIVVSFVLHLVLWQTPGKSPKTRNPAMQRKRLQTTRDPQQANPEKQSAIRKLCSRRLVLQIVCIVLCACFFGLFLFFALVNSTFYPDAAKATAYVKSLMPVFVPCVTLCIGFGILTVSLRRRMDEKLIALYKQCPPLPRPKTAGKQTWVIAVRCAVLGLAVVAMVYGLVTGGWQDVLTKAVNICTECVGLG